MRTSLSLSITSMLVLLATNFAFARNTRTTTTTTLRRSTTTTTCRKRMTTTTTTVPKHQTTTTTTTLPPVNHQPPTSEGTTVFGPKQVTVGLFGSGSSSDSFHGLTQTPQAGQLLVTLGGDDLQCGSHPHLLCLLKQAIQVLLRPDSVEIVLNGQTVLKQKGYPITQKYDQVNVTVNAINQLKVNLKGFPFSWVKVEVKSQGSVQHPNPLASYTFSPTTGIAPQIFSFNALTSTASGATIASYSWDFGDGLTDSGSIVVHSFVNAGTYPVKLTVTDSLGGVGTTTQNVVVIANQLPVPSFVTTVLSGSGLGIHFDASASSDSDGGIVNYAWDFGDGQVATGAIVDHTFAMTATYPVSLTVTDDKNGSKTLVQQVVARDTTLPVLSLQSPGENSTIQSFNVLIAGTSNKNLSSLTAQLDGENLVNISLAADQKSFSQAIVAGHEGVRILTMTGTDLSGNSTTIQVSFHIVVNLPPIAKLTLTEPSSNIAPLMVVFDASSSMSPQGKALHYQFDFGDGKSANSANGIVSHQFVTAGIYTIIVSVIDSSGIQSQAQTVVTTTDPALPPMASTQAPALSTTTPQAMVDTIRFLYAGPNPVQTNVQDGAIDPARVAVLQGTVVDVDGNPISGAKIDILEMPQVGQTLTDADGKFHIVVNGGGTLTVTYSRNGYFSIQRKIATTVLDYFTVQNVVMLRPDAKVTQVTMGSSQIQTVVGSTVSDSSGSRTSVLVLPAGTTASLQMPDGSTKQVSTLSLRTTEYTVGDQGRLRMPADLPATTSYTYAQDISSDEAIAAGATHVLFSHPIPNYVDNFLNFPVGSAVPYGSYDYQLGAWKAEKDGVVLKVLDVQNGQAVIDMDGSGSPASAAKLAQINMTGDELSKIASLYSVGKSFWRVQVSHLSPGDYNWVFAGSPFSIPTSINPILGNLNNCECSLTSKGSIIGVDQMTLGEHLDLPGVPSQLTYNSIAKPGYSGDHTITVPLILGDLPSGNSITNIHMHIEIAGQVYDQDFVPQSNLSAIWTWNGKDNFGRTVNTSVNARVTLTYSSPSLYFVGPFVVDGSTFGETVLGWLQTGVYGRAPAEFQTTVSFGLTNMKLANSSDVGGWTFDQVHNYDPVGKSLYMGNGEVIDTSKLTSIVAVIGGSNYQTGNSGDGDYLINARFRNVSSIQVGADNSIFILDGAEIRKVSPDGIINRVVGNGSSGMSIDGILAIDSPMGTISEFAVAQDGSIYFALSNENKIKKVGPDGILQTIAGNGGYDFSGDGGPALQAQMRSPTDLVRAADGTIYFIDSGNCRIRKISPDGIISTFAGNGISDSTGDGGSALAASLYSPAKLAIGINKELYFIETTNYQVRVITNDGIIHHFAGVAGVSGPSNGDGIPASRAVFSYVSNIDIGQDGVVYIADFYNGLIRSVTADGLIRTVAGSTNGGVNDGTTPYFTNVAAANLLVYRPWALKVFNKDQILLSQGPDLSIYQPALPGINPDGYSIGSKDGSEIYQFSSLGIHLQTLFAKTGKIKWSFKYDQNGRIASMTDANGNVTTINRNGNGYPTSIVGPYGQTNLTAVNAEGFLSSLTMPTGEVTSMSYLTGGLLSEFKKPKGNSSTFQYDSTGKLLKDTDAAGGFKSLVQSIVSGYKYIITQSTAMGRLTSSTVDSGGSTIFTSYTTNFSNGNQATQTQGVSQYDYSDSAGTNYYGYNKGIDPRLAGITQFYTAHFGNYDYVQEDSQYTPLSATDYFKYIQYKTTSIRSNPNGNLVLRSTYNSVTKTENISTDLGKSQQIISDDQQRPVQVTSGSFLPVTYSYNSDGSLNSIQQGNRATNFTYSPLRQLASVTDGEGNQTQFAWDASNRLTQSTRADGKATKYSYDANSNITGIQPPDSLLHSFAANLIDLFAVYNPPSVPNTGGYSYAYNLDQQLISYTRPDGGTVNFTYDQITGNLTNITGTLKSILYQYAYNGVLNNANSSDGDNVTMYSVAGVQPSRSYQYHDVNSNVSIAYVIGDGPRFDQIKYYTDNTTNVPEVTIENTFDNDNMLIQSGNLIISRDVANGAITSTQLENVQQTLQYNGYGEISQDSTTASGNQIFSQAFVRDRLGRITQKTENIMGTSTTYSYVYDSVGRLKSVSQGGAQTASYSYDSNGNRTSTGSQASTYDAQDRIIQLGNNNYTFDANGSLSQKQNGTDVTKYQYDDFGQLAQVNLPSGHIVKYLIDGEANRAEKLLDGVVVQKFMYHQNGSIAAELYPNAKIKSAFIYGTQSHSPDYMLQSGTQYKFIKDQRGSVRLVINASTGAIMQRLDYDEFGQVLQDTNPGFQPFGFAGGLYDSDTKLVRFGARDYDPETGRWTAKDPTLFAGGTNLYGYSFNDPVNFIDRDGNFPFLISGAIGATIGFAAGATVAAINHTNILQGALIGAGTGFLAGSGAALFAGGATIAGVGFGGEILAGGIGGAIGGFTGSVVSQTAVTGHLNLASAGMAAASGASGGVCGPALGGGAAGDLASGIVLFPVDILGGAHH